jgi:Ca-activated chloride channel family protein
MQLASLNEEVTVSAGVVTAMPARSATVASAVTDQFKGRGGAGSGQRGQLDYVPARPRNEGESYLRIESNRFHRTDEDPLSTFGADVDTASFSNVRRFLAAGQLPPRDAVRVEELLNYFRFQYPEPRSGQPIALTTEVGDCPWAPGHKLVLVGARARPSADREVGGRNIVLLLDVSGSMEPAERLPLIKTAFGMWVDTLRPDDRIAIVTYAGSSGLALPSTAVRNRQTIHRAIDALSAGGSTNGGDGLRLAYRTARESFVAGGVNRVILATDGDFNVGVVDQSDLVRLIQREKESGVFLSVFGVGSGNLKDSTMELLADRGNGHYAYLDSLQEARRVLIREGDATLETVAKDVKFQVEFNPATVTAWKLIGYEDRALAAEDFNNDRKDGGEMGAGHTVTVLYEIVPAGASYPESGDVDRPLVDPLKYQSGPVARPRPAPRPVNVSGELLTVKVRYQPPDGSTSRLIEHAVRAGGGMRHLPFASAVADFGLLLRDDRAPRARWNSLQMRLKTLSVSTGRESDRETFAELVELAAGLRRNRN